jgi:hypothetical protein
MQAVVPQSSLGDKVLTGFLNLLIAIAGIVVLYYAYKFLTSPTPGTSEYMVQAAKEPMSTLKKYKKVAPLYEGGEYTLNCWVYIAGYSTHLGTRKHILEIGGDNFATLLLALGAYKNTLLVRVHTKAMSGGISEAFRIAERFQNDEEDADTNTNVYGDSQETEDTGAGVRRGAGGGAASGDNGASDTSGTDTTTQTETSDVSGVDTEQINQAPTPSTDYNDPSLLAKEDTSLTNDNKDVLFSPLAIDDGLLNVFPMCDIQEIDMQRWVQVTVVLNGRNCDVYMNGKLTRSCVLRNYYKVDSTDITMKVADRGGFDGYTARIATYSSALNPDQIYKLYMAGPDGENMNPIQYVKNIL